MSSQYPHHILPSPLPYPPSLLSLLSLSQPFSLPPYSPSLPPFSPSLLSLSLPPSYSFLPPIPLPTFRSPSLLSLPSLSPSLPPSLPPIPSSLLSLSQPFSLPPYSPSLPSLSPSLPPSYSFLPPIPLPTFLPTLPPSGLISLPILRQCTNLHPSILHLTTLSSFPSVHFLLLLPPLSANSLPGLLSSTLSPIFPPHYISP